MPPVMVKCPSCSSEITNVRRFCPDCGALLEDVSSPTLRPEEAQTLLQGTTPSSTSPRGGDDGQPSPSPTEWSSSSDSLDNARFVPGTILANRYRIVGLLGQGGMGEVYRAEDLKLSQPVALKFLPERLARDSAVLARFRSEVRIARQVSHPNVCRVFDIGEVDGQQYLSMEYIDGEDLSSLLKRIGRISEVKAVEIAQQLCAGLAAAHDAGVLHRDLKPSNIMIDGRGKVRITDFGLAGLTEEFNGDDARSGTPAYMAPEQLAGNEVTIKSDLYALGLVLYELFTGKKAFEADSLPELLQLRRSDATPTSPSTLVKDLDPLVERAILRCLEKDPQQRLSSAIQLAAALPGGDPLAAALAAGETPSPEMVAAARKEGALRQPVAAAYLSGVLIGLALIILLSGKVLLHRLVPLEKPPAALADRASEIIKKAGYTDPPTDSAFGFSKNEAYLRYVKEHDSSPTRWETLATGQPAAMGFWYRQSPRYLEPYNNQVVTGADPPLTISGMAGVLLDTQGRLRSFYGVPPQVDDAQERLAPPDWSMLFDAAGFDLADFKPTESKWVPWHAYDIRTAWEGVYPQHPEIPIRIEAAAYRDRPVSFEIIHPWDKPIRQEQERPGTNIKIVQGVIVAVLILILLGGVLLARRNLQLGRGDRNGAFRLAFFAFSVTTLWWVCLIHHVPTFKGEFSLIFNNVGISLLLAGFLWLVYIALEPSVRRRWPERIISWTRLLAGDFRDPLVGRDILIGALFGVLFILSNYLKILVPKWLDWPPDVPIQIHFNVFLGVRAVVGMFANQLVSSLIAPSIALFLLLLLSLILRKEWLAIGGVWLIFTSFDGLTGDIASMAWIFGAANAALLLLLLIRFGLLALIVAEFYLLMSFFYPMTSQFSAWYAGPTRFALGVSLALAIYGFYRSLAGQPLFEGRLLQD